MTKVRVATGVAIVTLLAISAGMVLREDGRRQGLTQPVDLAQPAEVLGAQACDRVLVGLAAQVARDAAAAEVLEDLRVTESIAVAARTADPRYVTLASGVGALRVALNDDDAAAARTAIEVVLAACEANTGQGTP